MPAGLLQIFREVGRASWQARSPVAALPSSRYRPVSYPLPCAPRRAGMEPVARERTLHSVRVSDEAAWVEVCAGRGDAFGEVFDRHRARVYRQARLLAPSWSDADDVVAITFLEAWRKRETVRFVDGPLLPWLLRTATFTASNLSRGTRRYRAALRRLPPGEAQPDHAEAFDDGDAMSALRGMSRIDQEVLTLCVIEGVDAEDAAQVMNVRVGTVKSRLSRATARLRAAVAGPSVVVRPEGVSDVL